MDDKHMPDLAALYTAVTETDPRITFSVKQPPEMLIRQPELMPEAALALGIKLLGKVLARTRELTEQHKHKT
jgi:hypothetical protein